MESIKDCFDSLTRVTLLLADCFGFASHISVHDKKLPSWSGGRSVIVFNVILAVDSNAAHGRKWTSTELSFLHCRQLLLCLWGI